MAKLAEIREFAIKNNIVLDEENPIKPGDFYIACRNTGCHLLEASYIKDSYIVATEEAYPFDVWECVRIKEI